jgi:hypothetical protein
MERRVGDLPQSSPRRRPESRCFGVVHLPVVIEQLQIDFDHDFDFDFDTDPERP